MLAPRVHLFRHGEAEASPTRPCTRRLRFLLRSYTPSMSVMFDERMLAHVPQAPARQPRPHPQSSVIYYDQRHALSSSVYLVLENAP